MYKKPRMVRYLESHPNPNPSLLPIVSVIFMANIEQCAYEEKMLTGALPTYSAVLCTSGFTFRSEACTSKTYPGLLPTVSVIIVSNNEAPSTLARNKFNPTWFFCLKFISDLTPIGGLFKSV